MVITYTSQSNLYHMLCTSSIFNSNKIFKTNIHTKNSDKTSGKLAYSTVIRDLMKHYYILNYQKLAEKMQLGPYL